MKKAISMMLALVIALTMVGLPAIAEAPQDASAPVAEQAQQPTAAPESAPEYKPAANAYKSAEVSLVREETALYQKSGKAIPSVGFPMTKNNKLIVRVSIQGGAKKATAKGRVSIGTDLDNPKADLAKVTLDKTKLAGKTEFSFSLKALANLTSGKEYKIFFQSAKSGDYNAIGRTTIGNITVLDQAAVDQIKAERAAQQSQGEAPADESKEETAEVASVEAAEAASVEAGADEIVSGESVAATAKDLRQKLTPSVTSMIPSDGKLTSTTSAVTVTVQITGGKKGEYVKAQALLLDKFGVAQAASAEIDANTQGSTTFTFLAASLQNLANDAVYDLVLNSTQTDVFAPMESVKLNRTLTTPALREARPALGAITPAATTWDLTDDKAKDVTLTVAASPAVKATFTILGKDANGADKFISASATLSDSAETKITFAAADLLGLAPSAATPYKIVVNTDPSDKYTAGAKDEDTKCTLAVTGTKRTAVTITAQTGNQNYTHGSAKALEFKDIVNTLDTGSMPVRITIGDTAPNILTYDASLDALKGTVTIPASVMNNAASILPYRETKKLPEEKDANGNIVMVANPYPVKIEGLGTSTVNAAAAVSLGTVTIAKTDDTTSIIKFTKAAVTNGTHSSGAGFGIARGVNQSLKIEITLTASRATTTGESIDLEGNLQLNYAEDSGKTDANGNKIYNLGAVYKEIPFAVGKVTIGGTSTYVTTLPITLDKQLIGTLKEDMYYITLKVAGNDKVQEKAFTAAAIGALTLNDTFLPTPVYNGRTSSTGRTWTKGGSKIDLKDMISFTNGVKGRTMKAIVYAVPTKMTTATTGAPTSGIKIAEQSVYSDGAITTYTLTKKGLEKLTGGKDYHLYIQGQKSDYNLATKIGAEKNSAGNTVDYGYLGKLTVKAASTSSGGGSSGGSSGGSGDSSGDSSGGSSDSSTDGGTDTVADSKSTAADTTAADQIAFGTYQSMSKTTLEWMLARQPLMGREFLKYLLNQKGSQKVAIPLAYIADATDPIKVPIVGGGQYDLGMAVFTPAKDGDMTGYTFSVEPKPYADTANLKMHLGADFEDLARTLSDADYYKPGDFVPVSTLKLAQLDGTVTYDPSKAEQVKIDSEVTNKITEWMAQG